jgi:hypothetical protein
VPLVNPAVVLKEYGATRLASNVPWAVPVITRPGKTVSPGFVSTVPVSGVALAIDENAKIASNERTRDRRPRVDALPAKFLKNFIIVVSSESLRFVPTGSPTEPWQTSAAVLRVSLEFRVSNYPKTQAQKEPLSKITSLKGLVELEEVPVPVSNGEYYLQRIQFPRV